MAKPTLAVGTGIFLVAVGIYALFFEHLPVIDTLLLLLIGAALFLYGSTELREIRARKRTSVDSPAFQRFFLNQIAGLREIGFFAEYAGPTDQEVAVRLRRKLTEEWGGHAGDWRRNPAGIALLDPERAAHLDTELTIPPGEGAYTDLLHDLARISRGAFTPQSIQERLTEDGNHVEVRFLVNGEEESIRARVDEDWIDPDFVTNLNPFVEESGRRFVIPDWGGQDFLVLCLTAVERSTLKGKLQWPIPQD